MKKISKACRGSSSNGGYAVPSSQEKSDHAAGVPPEGSNDMDLFQDSMLLKEIRKPGGSLEKIEKKIKMTKAKKKRFDKFVAIREQKLERQKLISRLALKTSDLPDVLVSSKTLGKKSLSQRRKERKEQESEMVIDV